MAVPGQSVLDASAWDDISTTTLRKRSKKISDNFTKSNALLHRLEKKGMRKPWSGGRSLVKELSYKANETVKRYSGYENLDIRPTHHLTAAEYTLRQMAVAVTMSGLEMLTNSGDSSVLNLLEQRIENAEQSLIEVLGGDVFSDGSADAGKQLGGLQLLVSDTGLGTVGGIDSSTWTFWRNKALDMSTSGLGVMSASTIQSGMNRMYLSLVLGNKHPDLILADQTAFTFYLESLQAIQRITKETDAQAGFQSLKYMGADVVLDGGIGGGNGPQDGRMYFLNTDTLFYSPHSERDMVPLNPTRHVVNQDAMVKLIAWAGTMGTTNRRMNGVLVA
jgi:hypothetical protein